jgi:hypothetical protein
MVRSFFECSSSRTTTAESSLEAALSAQDIPFILAGDRTPLKSALRHIHSLQRPPLTRNWVESDLTWLIVFLSERRSHIVLASRNQMQSSPTHSMASSSALFTDMFLFGNDSDSDLCDMLEQEAPSLQPVLKPSDGATFLTCLFDGYDSPSSNCEGRQSRTPPQDSARKMMNRCFVKIRDLCAASPLLCLLLLLLLPRPSLQ